MDAEGEWAQVDRGPAQMGEERVREGDVVGQHDTERGETTQPVQLHEAGVGVGGRRGSAHEGDTFGMRWTARTGQALAGREKKAVCEMTLG